MCGQKTAGFFGISIENGFQPVDADALIWNFRLDQFRQMNQ